MKEDDQKTEALETLKQHLKEGDTVYTLVKHVARSGMSRVIAFYAIQKNNEPFYMSYYVAKILDRCYVPERDGVRVHGCGMDMCFEAVYNVSCILFGSGDKLRVYHL